MIKIVTIITQTFLTREFSKRIANLRGSRAKTERRSLKQNDDDDHDDRFRLQRGLRAFDLLQTWTSI